LKVNNKKIKELSYKRKALFFLFTKYLTDEKKKLLFPPFSFSIDSAPLREYYI